MKKLLQKIRLYLNLGKSAGITERISLAAIWRVERISIGVLLLVVLGTDIWIYKTLVAENKLASTSRTTAVAQLNKKDLEFVQKKLSEYGVLPQSEPLVPEASSSPLKNPE